MFCLIFSTPAKCLFSACCFPPLVIWIPIEFHLMNSDFHSPVFVVIFEVKCFIWLRTSYLGHFEYECFEVECLSLFLNFLYIYFNFEVFTRFAEADCFSSFLIIIYLWRFLGNELEFRVYTPNFDESCCTN